MLLCRAKRCWTSSSSTTEATFQYWERLEPGLLEIPVTYQCLTQSFLDERHAIGQRLFFVWPLIGRKPETAKGRKSKRNAGLYILTLFAIQDGFGPHWLMHHRE